MCVHGHQVNWDQEAWDEYHRGLSNGRWVSSQEVERRRVARVGKKRAEEMAAAEAQAYIDEAVRVAEVAAYAEAEKRRKAEDLRAMLRARKAAAQTVRQNAAPVRELTLA